MFGSDIAFLVARVDPTVYLPGQPRHGKIFIPTLTCSAGRQGRHFTPVAKGVHRVRRTLQTTVNLTLAILLAGAWISTTPVSAQLGGQPGGVNPKALAERVGTDDGYAVSIQFSGDLHGSLETCG